MKLKPRGELCVAPDRTTGQWAVMVCDGHGEFQLMHTYGSKEAAMQFAMDESTRREGANGKPVTVHFPDDCPCYCNITARL